MRIAGVPILLGLMAGLLGQAPVALASATPETIPEAIASSFDGRDLRVGKVKARTAAYTRYAVSYRSGDLRITGVMNVPTGKGPFPVVVLAHGYIDPQVYWSGQGFRREQDTLARKGYVAFHVDDRNHAGSDDDPATETSLRIGSAMDVINAALAIRAARLPYIDADRIALLGRSMGGSVAFNAAVIRPGTFDAIITYAATSTNAIDNFTRWQRYDADRARAIVRRFGDPRTDRSRWALASSENYFERITEPVLMIHGTRDEDCPIAWARTTKRGLDAAGVQAELMEVPGGKHYLLGDWPASMRRVLGFLQANLS
ncbi:MAG: alpha/beta hydrolase family protein [Actinomycetales bacterium]